MNAIKNIETLLGNGDTPSYGEIEAALEQALLERNFSQRVTEELFGYISSMVTAHLCKDDVAVKDILDCFIEKKVKIVRPQSKKVH